MTQKARPLVLSAGKHRELMLTRTEILKRDGLDVVTAATCEQLLQRLALEHFDLVIFCHTFKEEERRRCAEGIRALSPLPQFWSCP